MKLLELSIKILFGIRLLKGNDLTVFLLNAHIVERTVKLRSDFAKVDFIQLLLLLLLLCIESLLTLLFGKLINSVQQIFIHINTSLSDKYTKIITQNQIYYK